MNNISKKRCQDIVDRFNTPALIYYYESSKLAAVNESGNKLLGANFTDMRYVFPEGKRVIYDADVLENGSEFRYSFLLNIDGNTKEVDIEVISMTIKDHHMIVWLFELGFKRFFSKRMDCFVPRMLWFVRDPLKTLEGFDKYFINDMVKFGCTDMKRYRDFFETESRRRLKELYDRVMKTKESVIDSIQVLNGIRGTMFVSMDFMPFSDDDSDTEGVFVIYRNLLSREEYQKRYIESVMEINKINEIMDKSDAFFMSVRLDEKVKIEFVSANISKYGYDDSDIADGTVTLEDMIIDEDYIKFKKAHKSIYMLVGNNEVVNTEFRGRTKDGDIRHFRVRIFASPEFEKDRIINCILHEIVDYKKLNAQLSNDLEALGNGIDTSVLKLSDLVDLSTFEHMQKIVLDKYDIESVVIDSKGNLLVDGRNMKDGSFSAFYALYSSVRLRNLLKKAGEEAYEANGPIIKETGTLDVLLIAIPYILGDNYLGALIMTVSQKQMEKIKEEAFVDVLARQINVQCLNGYQNLALESEKRIISERAGRLSKSKSLLNSVLDNIDSYVYVLSHDSGIITFVNKKTRDAYGSDVVGSDIFDFLENNRITVYDDNAARTDRDYCISDNAVLLSETKYYDAVNDRYLSLNVKETEWINGQNALIVTMHDITAIVRRQQKIEGQAYRDFLTGLPNRLRFEIDSSECIRRARETNKNGAIILFDLDDFKHINDGLGHESGDQLLKNIADMTQQIPEIKDRVYRFGGDEFLIILDSTLEGRIQNVIDRILNEFRRPWMFGDKEYYCTMSMGVTSFPGDGVDAAKLLKNADIAMYEAKKLGKNRVAFYKPVADDKPLERINMEKNLRKAILSGCVEFEVYYQPIVNAKTKKIVGAEALLRWKSPEMGTINPVEFIPLSEYLGLIIPLGDYVCTEAFKLNNELSSMGMDDLKINVNLSVVQLVQHDIIDKIRDMARQTGTNCKNIVFEVTESLAIDDMSLMKRVLGSLKETGFSIALDDFGTGYSSLNNIMEMPLDYIKIDKSFIENYGKENFNPGLLSAITDLAHSVNLEVVVEGVETKQQMEFLMFLTADRYQGYLFGKPMTKKEFLTLLKKERK